MEQELKTIYEAQKLETKILEIEKKMVSTPKRIEEMDKEIDETKKTVEREKAVIDELEKERKKKEKELDADKEKIKKIEARLYDVKTNKEYQALLKEIELAKETNDKTEEDVIVLMEKIEDLRKEYNSLLQHLKKREKETQEEKKILQDELDTIDKTLSELKQQRDNMIGIVSKELRNVYATLIEKRGGLAVVNVKNGVCLGCFMNIPPQLFIEATKNRTLITCPSCNRIFYFREDD